MRGVGFLAHPVRKALFEASKVMWAFAGVDQIVFDVYSLTRLLSAVGWFYAHIKLLSISERIVRIHLRPRPFFIVWPASARDDDDD